MIEWMAKGGSEHSKMRLRFYESTHRGVHAACNIKLGDIILKIPENNIVSQSIMSFTDNFETPVPEKSKIPSALQPKA